MGRLEGWKDGRLEDWEAAARAAERVPNLRFAIAGYIPSFFNEMTAHDLIQIENFFDTSEDDADAA